MTYSSLTTSAISLLELQNSLNNIISELKMDRLLSPSKDTIIKYLDFIVIKFDLYLHDNNVAQEIIKNINAYIQALCKRLEMPTRYDR